MKTSNCTEHLYGWFVLKIEGERDRYYLGCCHCGRKVFHGKNYKHKPPTKFHIEENLKIINENIDNAEKYFENDDTR